MPYLPNEPRDLTKLRQYADDGLFAKEAVRRVEALRFGISRNSNRRDREQPWKPGGKIYKGAAAMARRCLLALKIAREAPGMKGKIDTGEKTLSGGRVLRTGIVLEATPAFVEPPGGSAKILHVLRMRDGQGRVWDETTRVTHVHKFKARKSYEERG